IEVPRIRRGEGQIHTLRVLVAIPAGPIEFSETALLVIDRMIQTIFMALVATTVAIPIAALISFFAAHNLMRRVRLTVGSMLMAFVLFIVGTWLGSSVLSIVGKWGLMVGRGELFAPIGALLAFVIPILVIIATGWVLARLQAEPDNKRSSQTNSVMQILNTVVSFIVAIFLVGALGGLGILGGEQISALADSIRPADPVGIGASIQNLVGIVIGSIGNLLLIWSELIELGIVPIAGVITGFAFAGIGASVLGNQLRRLRGTTSYVLAAIMGAISGATLMLLLTTIALWASLLAILPLLIGGILGGQVLRQITGIFLDRSATPIDGVIIKSNTRRFAEWLIFWLGFAIIFVWMFNAMNVGRSFVDGTLPPQTTATLLGFDLPVTVYVYTAMLFGAVLAGISGALTGLHGVFPLGNLLYNTSRTSLNVVRSIEPLIMGLVFVIWVGIGPFAGVLALTLHSIAALGKLYSEQIENIDPGPIEALESTGANQLQTIIYAVVPQIIPPYIAFTMYRWDINVRMSTIIGFVGGGGIGLLLQQQINLLRYRDAGVAVLAIAIVVSILDYASAYIRERVL
ncbi:MAG: ABC transporter permease subunit, partial [Phototrophicaceae bacterium]